MNPPHLLAVPPTSSDLTVIWTVVPLAFFLAIAAIVWAFVWLQARRADAVAMAEYRKLAEDAVANQQELRAELSRLTEKVGTVEKLMRDVG
jgi:ABC-type Zn2+ transport system substrate-binding protein/surface adhesin